MLAAVVTAALPAQARTSPPERWGTTFCASLRSWSETISESARGIQSSTSGAETTPAEGKALIVEYLGGLADTTRAFRVRVQKAGDPDTDEGPRIETLILRGIAGTEARIGELQILADAVPTGDAASFQGAVDALISAFDTVRMPFDRAMVRVATLDRDDSLSDVLLAQKVCRKTLR